MWKKTNIYFHLIAQILAQGAVVEIVPAEYKPYFMALVAIVGVLVAFTDQSLSK
jgi:hypothetical protein